MVVGIVILGFLITHILPGDPVDVLVGDYPAPPEYIAQVRHEFGLDQSLAAQLWLYLANLARGNLGFSFLNREPVLSLVVHRAGVTLLLMVPSLVLASVLGVLIAVRAAARAGRALDSFLTGLSLIGYSIPVFWLAQILIVIFAVQLAWLPAQGMTSIRSSATGAGALVDFLRHLALPAFCITIYYLAVVARVTRSSMIEMLHQDVVLTARAKGLSERRILIHHVLRNSLIPVVTFLGADLGALMGGAIITEGIFNIPGVGHALYQAIIRGEGPTVVSIVTVLVIIYIITSLLVDLLYAVLDPRIRYV